MQAIQSVNVGYHKPAIFHIKTARREKVKIKLALTGVSGSGKTLSSLLLAYGICGDWRKVYLADTENKSSIFYAGERTGEWNHIDFPATIRGGYHPDNWLALIETVEKTDAEVLILDSFSHAWIGEGGMLDVADRSGRGNSFTGWKTATPLQRHLLERIRSSRLHIIATMRSVTEYCVETNEKGKAAPKKVGLKPQQREGTEYEFDIMLDLDIENNAACGKDRSGIFRNRGGFKITPEVGKELLEWSNQGESFEDSPYEGLPEQRKELAKIFAEKGVQDIDRMKVYAERCRGIVMKDLASSVEGLIAIDAQEG